MFDTKVTTVNDNYVSAGKEIIGEGRKWIAIQLINMLHLINKPM